MVSLLPLQFGIPGGPELLVILLIAVLLFGANKIPKLARSTGEAMGEFQKGREEVEQELQEMRDPSTSSSDDEPSVETEEAAVDSETQADSETETGSESQTDTESETADDLEIDDAEAEETSNT